MLERIFQGIQRRWRRISRNLHDLKNLLITSDIVFVSEEANWVIKDICLSVTQVLNKNNLVKTSVVQSPKYLRNKLLHFGSITAVPRNTSLIHPSNKFYVTWFHVAPNDAGIEKISFIMEHGLGIVTAAKSTKEKLLSLGVPDDKIIVMPLQGIDLDIFKPVSAEQKISLRKKINIPERVIVVGSFQKDGEGWGEGIKPKLIKGPDIFCGAVEKLAEQYPIHVLLTGPARGYVKQRLSRAGVPYTHHYPKKPSDVVPYFQVCDLYIVASRVEGGPRAILEAWATGIPLVSTKVGIIPDRATPGEDVLLYEVGDINGLIQGSRDIIEDSVLRQKLITNGLKSIQKYSWQGVAKSYYDNLYKGLLD